MKRTIWLWPIVTDLAAVGTGLAAHLAIGSIYESEAI